MGTFKIKRKFFSKYDETDNLKRMKDSDILAEKKKESPSLIPTARAGVTGALAGGAILGTAGMIKAKKAGSSILKGGKKGAIAGALVGAAALGAAALKKREKESEDNHFYNKRLEYAQKQAKRREAKDWKENMTQRDGYSY